MTRRSETPKPKKVPNLSPSVQSGLHSLVTFAAPIICQMLGLPKKSSHDTLYDAILQVLQMNKLSPEHLLAQFFEKEVLADYAGEVCGLGMTGNVAVLAGRIGKAWGNPRFVPIGEEAEEEEVEEEEATAVEEEEEESEKPAKRAKANPEEGVEC
jgi:hypothetical protein